MKKRKLFVGVLIAIALGAIGFMPSIAVNNPLNKLNEKYAGQNM